MKQYDAIIIGFGKGGKTLAGALADAGKKVAVVEQSDTMYGGTCINVGCIPSKSLIKNAKFSYLLGGSFEEKAARYQKAIEEKEQLTAMLRMKNYHKLADNPNIEVINGKASFLSSVCVQVQKADGTEELEGGQIFINTGSSPFIPPIEGLSGNPFVYGSETLLALKKLPKRLVIIGGGYIGMEFASMYTNFGSSVTVIQNEAVFLPREDREIADTVKESLLERGVQIIFSGKIMGVRQKETGAEVVVITEEGEKIFSADAVLTATGRRPNVTGLSLEKAGVALTERGAVQTDTHLRTTSEHIWAMGDVTGGLQFTYISLDDFRIVKSQVLSGPDRTTENRGAVPYSVFLDPPFSRVGLSEKEAKEQGYQVKIAKLMASAIPKAQVLKETTGILKAVIDADTGKILGAHLFCAESHEIIQIFKLAMDTGLPYSVLRDSIYTHPTMSEALNDLFAGL